MKILHLADLHIGKIVNNYSMLKDQRFVLEQVLGMLKEHEVTALALAGDIYDKTTPSAEAVSCFDWFITQVSELGITVLAIPGNHDSADRLAFGSQIMKRQNIHFASHFNGELECVQLPDKHGMVNFWLIPFLNPTSIRPYFPEADFGRDYTEALSTVLDAVTIDPTQRNVAISHQFVTGSASKTERAEEELSLGGTDNVDATVYSNFDYVALGHVHRAQRLAGREEVRYSGSPLKYSSSEARYEKSAVLVTIGDKPSGSQPGSCATIELLPLIPLHDVRCIKGTLEELTSPEVLESADVNDYVYVTLTDEFRPHDATDRIRAHYPNFMSITHERPGSENATGVEALAQGKKVDPLELFGSFFEQQVGHELTAGQYELAHELLTRALGVQVEGADADQKGGQR